MKHSVWLLCLLVFPGATRSQDVPEHEALSGTQSLTWSGDIASRLVDAADSFLLREIDRSIAARESHWQRDPSSPNAYAASVAHNRDRFERIIGAHDERPFRAEPELERLGTIAACTTYTVEPVRWPVFTQVHGEGLMLEPIGRSPAMDVVVVPDPGQHPEQLAGIQDGLEADHQTARRLAERGCRVIVPTIINRETKHRRLTNREFLYRPAFELGRHLIGSEVQKISAAIDWFRSDDPATPIGVAGWGGGGLLALYAAAIDTRIDRTLVSGYFGPRREIWKEPADHNVFGLLEQFGDAELATLILPRSLIVEARASPVFEIPPGTGGKPGAYRSPSEAETEAEIRRAIALSGLPGAARKLSLGHLDTFLPSPAGSEVPAIKLIAPLPNQKARHERQFEELNRHYQWLLTESAYVRADYMKQVKTDGSLQEYVSSLEPYRTYFAEDVIGRFDYEIGEPAPRTRLLFKTDKVTAFETVLDVFPGLFAYGILLKPNDLKPGEARPAVVCQHGLEGRPQHVIGEEGFHAYKAFATKLAERGFVTFAPQNLYIFEDRFRTLQFKANAIKKTLFSLMVPQHEQIVRWLGSLDFVDADRIAFYGLSYGGKSAMRIPPLVRKYCLSICSADFNEWVWKNASTRSPYSYVWTGEYEIFEFDLGSTFNYAEMAALIAPRPFMVERGHHDGVAPDETVAYEYAKVRRLYTALGIADRTTIEWFDGPHTINGKGTFDFLHRHLDWPVPDGKQ